MSDDACTGTSKLWAIQIASADASSVAYPYLHNHDCPITNKKTRRKSHQTPRSSTTSSNTVPKWFCPARVRPSAPGRTGLPKNVSVRETRRGKFSAKNINSPIQVTVQLFTGLLTSHVSWPARISSGGHGGSVCLCL